MKVEELKRTQVGYLDTPLEFMPNLTKRLGRGKLYIKRDDLTGIALGGNKARKLDYLVQYAKDNGYTALMTFGGVQTNHGRITVAAAIKHGLKPILVLKGPKPEFCTGNLILDRLMGADIIFVDTSAADALPAEERDAAAAAYLEESTQNIIARYEAMGEKVLNIPVGGQGVIGSAGYIQAIPEIMGQMEKQGITAKYLVAGYGSTGTFAGLWAGAKYYNAPFEVIGIPVDPTPRALETTVAFINELSDFYELGIRCVPEDLHLEMGVGDHAYGGIGYNLPDSVTLSYIQLLAQEEAIFTDPCYTGKVLHGFVDMIEKGAIPYGENAILLHTGGIPGLWSQEHLDRMQKAFWTDDTKDHVTVYKL